MANAAASRMETSADETFATALTFAFCRHRNATEDIDDALIAAEATVLSHTPRTLQEAADIIDILLGGGLDRTDELDIAALVSIRAFLRGFQAGQAALTGEADAA